MKRGFQNPNKYKIMKPLIFLLGLLGTLQVYSQNPNPPLTLPGSSQPFETYDSQDYSSQTQSSSLSITEIGAVFGQDFPSGNSAHMYLESRLVLSHGNQLWALSYGLSNPWDFGIGSPTNTGNTSIISAAYGRELNLFAGLETQAYLGLSHLSIKTEEGSDSFWGLPLTLVVDKPIFQTLTLGLVGQLQPTTKKGRALFGLKLSYHFNG